MEGAEQRRTREAILDVVIELLESEGYRAVQQRTVAKRARVGLDTIYRHFANRDELIIEAVARWMSLNGYAELPLPDDDVSLYHGLMELYRHVFEPWERNPHMLEAFYRARMAPGGERLEAQGLAVLQPISRALFAGADPAYIRDFRQLLNSVVYTALGRFTNGELEITEVLPLIERTVYRMTTDNSGFADRRRTRRGRARLRRNS